MYLASMRKMYVCTNFLEPGTCTNHVIQIGKLVYEELLQENFNRILSPNHTQSRRVRRVVSRVLSASNLGKIRGSARDSSSFGGPGQLWGNDEASWNPDSQRESTYQPETHREWEVVVVDNPRVINAMAAPGARLISNELAMLYA